MALIGSGQEAALSGERCFEAIVVTEQPPVSGWLLALQWPRSTGAPCGALNNQIAFRLALTGPVVKRELPSLRPGYLSQALHVVCCGTSRAAAFIGATSRSPSGEGDADVSSVARMHGAPGCIQRSQSSD